MKKQILALLLAMCMCVSMLIACDSQQGDSDDAADSGSNQQSGGASDGDNGETDDGYEYVEAPEYEMLEYKDNGEYAYEVYDGCVGIVEYLGSDTVVVIPDTIDGLPVKMVSGFAFEDVTSVTVPNGVTTIGFCAFSNCGSLTEVNLPDSLIVIEDQSFWECTSLTEIVIPSGTKYINAQAFLGTPWYDALTDEFVIVGDGVLFKYNGNDAEVKIPKGVRYVSGFAYNLNTERTPITKVTLPDGVAIIGDSAFSECYDLEEINIPDSVKCVENGAFAFCSALKEATLPDTVVKIGRDAFAKCVALSSFSVPESVTVIPDQMLYGCRSLTSVTIPNGVTSIGTSAFDGCSGLTSLTIPNNVTSIGFYAFSGCDSLTLTCTAGSYAETYAVENDVPYETK